MALCPACFKTDKEFFASKCHACNTRIPFLVQCFYSAAYGLLALGGFIGFFWLFGKVFG
jgi:hypothetical protein